MKWVDSLEAWFFNHGLKILLIIFVAYVVNKIIYRFIEQAVRLSVLPGQHVSKEAEKQREDTLIHIITNTSKTIVILTATLMVLSEFGVMIGPILAAAGILGLALGFGGQYLIRDIITGLFIIIENQYRIGDLVSFDNTSGIVEAITLRKTTLRDVDGSVHHVPHGEVKKVTNLTKDFSVLNLYVNVSYQTNVEHLIKVVNQVGAELTQDEFWGKFISRPIIFARISDFTNSGMSVKIVGQTKVHKKRAVAGELRMRLKIAFDNEKIEMPYPQMVLHQVDNALQELPNADKTQKETPKMDNPKDPNYSTEVKTHAQKPSL